MAKNDSKTNETQRAPTHIVVRAKADAGFRRAGRHWPAVETTVPLSEFDDAQIKALSSERELDVSFIALAETAEG